MNPIKITKKEFFLNTLSSIEDILYSKVSSHGVHGYNLKKTQVESLFLDIKALKAKIIDNQYIHDGYCGMIKLYSDEYITLEIKRIGEVIKKEEFIDDVIGVITSDDANKETRKIIIENGGSSPFLKVLYRCKEINKYINSTDDEPSNSVLDIVCDNY